MTTSVLDKIAAGKCILLNFSILENDELMEFVTEIHEDTLKNFTRVRFLGILLRGEHTSEYFLSMVPLG